LENLKPAFRLMAHDAEVQKINDFCARHHLSCVLSDFKVAKADTGSYSDRGIRIPAGSAAQGKLLAYISKDKLKAELAGRFEEKNNHINLGMLLGYPGCCCEFFDKNFEEESKKRNDYIMPAFRNSKGKSFPFHNNVLARYFDIGLLSHFPCSFSCKASKEIAASNLECLKKHSNDAADNFERILRSAAIYDDGKIFLLLDACISGDGNDKAAFSDVLATDKNDFYRTLMSEKECSLSRNMAFFSQ
jgi:hypothetical protein